MRAAPAALAPPPTLPLMRGLLVERTLGGREAAALAQAASEEAMRRALEAEEDLALVRTKLAEYELVQKQAAEGEERAVRRRCDTPRPEHHRRRQR